ncbi:hypothetical protein SAY86_002246 [Trapa natans]|uniref:GDSL esterase/lipase n=1 Tax=Trapa natans TaxID=22666 RepID=A0AAN7LTH3_TRANT|nr:hypothetical protein SAY86_002246 [Trapa natans]
MAKAAFLCIQATILVLALSISPSESHNKTKTTNIYNTNVNIDLGGAFDRVYAFGDSGTDNGNARLTGNLQNFVGSWLRALHGKLAVDACNSDSASDGDGVASGPVSGGGGRVASGPGSGGGGVASGSVSGGGASGNESEVGNGLSNGKLLLGHICGALGIPEVPPYKPIRQLLQWSKFCTCRVHGTPWIPPKPEQQSPLLHVEGYPSHL